MYISKSGSQVYSITREQKQQLFEKHWNDFLRNPVLTVLLVLFTLSHIPLLISAHGWLSWLVVATGLFRHGYSPWLHAVFAVIDLLIITPGVITACCMWYIRSHSHWPEQGEPNIKGFRFIRKMNIVLSILGGISLYFYPTVISLSGEYLKPTEVLIIFDVYLGITTLFVLNLFLIRSFWKTAESNLLCRWAKTKYMVWLTICLLVTTIGIAWGNTFFHYSLAFSLLCIIALLVFYIWKFKRLSKVFDSMDQKAAEACSPEYDDAYNQY